MSAPLRVVVVDDEPLARARLRRLLARAADVALVAECADAESAAAAIARHRPDVVFLDVDLPDGTGFDVAAARAPDAGPVVVFVTAYEEFARRAFDADAVDYLLKPYDAARLEGALERVRRRLHEAPPARDDDARVTVKAGDDLVVLRLADVDWIGAADNYVELHIGGRTYLLRGTLAALERTLDPRRFLRVHRGAIVNVERVRALRPGVGGDWTALLDGGTEVRVGRAHKDAVGRRFGVPGVGRAR